eukprot:6185349-Pleurochrysis_carterae.AAC.2
MESVRPNETEKLGQHVAQRDLRAEGCTRAEWGTFKGAQAHRLYPTLSNVPHFLRRTGAQARKRVFEWAHAPAHESISQWHAR